MARVRSVLELPAKTRQGSKPSSGWGNAQEPQGGSAPGRTRTGGDIHGHGSAGCAVTNRLTADGKHRVLLLEAGGRDGNYNIHIPLCVANVLNDTRWTWPYMTEPQTHLNGKEQKWARGRVDRKSTRLNSSHIPLSRMPSSA